MAKYTATIQAVVRQHVIVDKPSKAEAVEAINALVEDIREQVFELAEMLPSYGTNDPPEVSVSEVQLQLAAIFDDFYFTPGGEPRWDANKGGRLMVTGVDKEGMTVRFFPKDNNPDVSDIRKGQLWLVRGDKKKKIKDL
jgi:hypothetical protein